MIRVFVGFDPSETVAYHVLCNSILKRSSGPVAFTPIYKKNIPGFVRGKEDGSTDFSFSRFLTPYLSGYEGQSIFMDCDMLVRCDLYEVMDYCGTENDVYVVQHDYIPKNGNKFLGNKNPAYPKKNWSSFMVFNNEKCKKLTLDAVNTESGKYLHRLEWADSVGSLPLKYNHLVGEYEKNNLAEIIHFTLGTPCFKGYENQEWAKEWFDELQDAIYAD